MYAMPELLRVKANALRRAGSADDIERCLQESLDCSRDQGARGWTLRAAIDLARHWMDCHRVADAVSLLRPLRESFTEGFDTADLRTADALLQELSAHTKV
jgi:predicted ATPase